MIPFLIAGAALLVGAVVVGVFWNEIKNFIGEALKHIKTVLVPSTIAGFKTYLQTGSIARALYSAANVALQKFYSRTPTGQWMETVVTRGISMKDIPEHILDMVEDAGKKEVDISQEVARELHLERA